MKMHLQKQQLFPLNALPKSKIGIAFFFPGPAITPELCRVVGSNMF